MVTEVTTVGGGGGALLLPGLGVSRTIYNASASPLPVYPPVGAAIDALSVNAPDTIPAGGVSTYDIITSTQVRSR
jgi:hypothetical protein